VEGAKASARNLDYQLRSAVRVFCLRERPERFANESHREGIIMTDNLDSLGIVRQEVLHGQTMLQLQLSK
jgi:hypothetical protein